MTTVTSQEAEELSNNSTNTSSNSNSNNDSSSSASATNDNLPKFAIPPPTKRLRTTVTIWKVKWNKKEYAIYFDETTKISDIKTQLTEEIGVQTHKQKLVGLKFQSKFKHNSSINDNTLISHLQCRSKKGFMMIGTLDKNAFKDDDIFNANVPYVINDFDWTYSINDSEIAARTKLNNTKLEKSISKTEINLIVNPRPGKKLLVLDIDYTIFDMRSKSLSWSTLKRPYTDHMLTQCYEYYDIVFWSQTSWKWIEIKLTEMDMLMNTNYKILFVLDKKCMFTIVSDFKQGQRKHHIKPLQLIWAKFSGIYHANNTIHIDDLARNFALNPKQGLTIKPFKNASKNSKTDKELLYLTQYLMLIGKKKSFQGLQHQKWKQYLAKTQQQQGQEQ